MGNIDLIYQLDKYLRAGDEERIRAELLHPDVVWRVPGHHPLAGEHHGAAEVMGYLIGLARTGIEFTDMHCGQLCDGSVAEKAIGHADLDGEEIELPIAVTYSFANNKIADVRVHPGDQHALDRFVWAAVALRPVTDRLEMAGVR
ncbi:MAG TPA: nuclear transport factor 2 family protein [Pseudonocardiaceae bacterium]|jgi:ketosteroid isomerase-like protein|nr:nuclear transport factor 2 family protein [Pseudonocardiaceae bacterium]